jgi:hypothetical protein
MIMQVRARSAAMRLFLATWNCLSIKLVLAESAKKRAYGINWLFGPQCERGMGLKTPDSVHQQGVVTT